TRDTATRICHAEYITVEIVSKRRHAAHRAGHLDQAIEGVIGICCRGARGVGEGGRLARAVDVPGGGCTKRVDQAASDTEVIGQLSSIAERIGDGHWLPL